MEWEKVISQNTIVKEKKTSSFEDVFKLVNSCIVFFVKHKCKDKTSSNT